MLAHGPLALHIAPAVHSEQHDHTKLCWSRTTHYTSRGEAAIMLGAGRGRGEGHEEWRVGRVWPYRKFLWFSVNAMWSELVHVSVFTVPDGGRITLAPPPRLRPRRLYDTTMPTNVLVHKHQICCTENISSEYDDRERETVRPTAGVDHDFYIMHNHTNTVPSALNPLTPTVVIWVQL